MMLAYLAGLLTLPALVAGWIATLHIAAEGSPRGAWSRLTHRPLLPAWSWAARRAGRHLAWEHYAHFSRQVDVWVAWDLRRARWALLAPWCPAILWPPHVVWCLATLVGIR